MSQEKIVAASIGDVPVVNYFWGGGPKQASSRQTIIAVRWGEIPVVRAILGLTTVMRVAHVWDTFNRPNNPLDADGRWVDYGSATTYRACIENTVARIGIPDGLTTTTQAVSYMRCATRKSTLDDGYIQCRVFSVGDTTGLKTYDTAVFAKVNDDFTDGVGIHLSGNTLGLVVRRNSIDTVVGTFGQFSTNDIIRITFNGDDYTVFCNSQQRGTWTDRLGQAVSDAAHRSLGIRVEGAASSDGVRAFSPALDHVELG